MTTRSKRSKRSPREAASDRAREDVRGDVRGAALIKRIKADPALIGCEIKIVANDGNR
jgi:hypothetical protein